MMRSFAEAQSERASAGRDPGGVRCDGAPTIADPVFSRRQWERRAPAAKDSIGALDEAIRYAQQNEAPWERDVFKQIQKDVANEPYPRSWARPKTAAVPPE